MICFVINQEEQTVGLILHLLLLAPKEMKLFGNMDHKFLNLIITWSQKTWIGML